MPIKEMSCDEGQERSFNQCSHTGKTRKRSGVFEGGIGTVRFYRKGEQRSLLGGCLSIKVCDLDQDLVWLIIMSGLVL